MIIATAGHVDHGKTSLIHQLTGVETDTLAEERERGLSINLGYAYLPRPEHSPLGFIDVPGHQRFINTMISGISGIDMGMLVVAADDGPMPQTLEHLDVLDLLGVEQLITVISKTDRVSTSRAAKVGDQVQTLLTARRWQHTPSFPISNVDGSGIAPLRSYLLGHNEQRTKVVAECGFRLSIDRCFSIKGAGLVVTGTASAGRVQTDDKLVLLPSGIQVRVRGIRAHDDPVNTAGAGQRVALNLTGKIDVADIQRGDWLVAPAYADTATRLDVAFSLLQGAPFPLKHLAPVKLYLGARRVAGRLALIDTEQRRLEPGDSGMAQLILESAVSAVHGERFLLRDHAENVILGGGNVLDPSGPRYGKSRPERQAWLQAMQSPTAEQALAQLIDGDQLVDLDRFWRIRHRTTPADLSMDARQFESEGTQWAVSRALWTAARQDIHRLIEQWHGAHPELPGIKLPPLKSELTNRYPLPLVMAILVSHLQAGDWVLHEGHIKLPTFQATESAAARAHWVTLREYLHQCAYQIPALSSVSAATGIPEPALKRVIQGATRAGDLHRLNDNRFALPEHLRHFSACLIAAQERGEDLSVVALKKHFDSGRTLTIELLEYFDSIRFTQRQGDTRIVIDSLVPEKQFMR